eukprot:m.13030 g.13030  ORF g.13030 m.13030 type:complete len:110 (-) comp5894_c0_seq1:71-400(-)
MKRTVLLTIKIGDIEMTYAQALQAYSHWHGMHLYSIGAFLHTLQILSPSMVMSLKLSQTNFCCNKNNTCTVSHEDKNCLLSVWKSSCGIELEVLCKSRVHVGHNDITTC